ncbi:MAG: chemotaxis protein CheW [Oligoflexia bacterium]|nr:chemotaxis protein CheW [Oligoflexia bacterium]
MDEETTQVVIADVHDCIETWEKTCLELEHNVSIELINTLFRVAHNLKGLSQTYGFIHFGKMVHTIEDIIVLIKKNPGLMCQEALAYFFKCHTLLSAWVDKMIADPNCLPQPALSKEILNQTRYLLLKFNSTTNTTECVANRPIEIEKSSLAENAKENRDKRNDGQLITKNSNIRVQTKKVDELIKIISELSIQLSIVNYHKKNSCLESPFCLKSIEASYKLIRELQQKGISLRLQGLANLFQKLERAALDVSIDLNKKIEVETKGEECELDKTVLEKIAEPLIHIIRNAVDHGLESEQERVSANKNKVGKIFLNASYVGNTLAIEISDDGKGLNYEKIRQKAIEKGIIREEEELSKNELAQLIFHAGLSTADKVTAISGRGVGMDVVKTTISSLSGSIIIESIEGQGTLFKIFVPLSLTLVEVLIVKLNKVRYLIPVQDIQEIVDLKKFKIQTQTAGKIYFDLRGEIVPIINLADFYPSVSSQQETPFLKSQDKQTNDSYLDINNKDRELCLIVEYKHRKIALKIDSLEYQEQIIARELTGQTSNKHLYKGCTVLGDGTPGLILDIYSVFSAFEHVILK